MNSTIRALVDMPDAASTVAAWLEEEWPDDLSISERTKQLLALDARPPTLVAISNDVPTGVLAFKRFVRNGDQQPSLFVDALYVHASVRRSGLGTALLAAGVATAATVEKRLFVYTSLPRWYASRGWSVVEAGPDAGCFVLDRSLP